MWVDFSTRPRNANRIRNSKGLEHPNNAENGGTWAVLTGHKLE